MSSSSILQSRSISPIHGVSAYKTFERQRFGPDHSCGFLISKTLSKTSEVPVEPGVLFVPTVVVAWNEGESDDMSESTFRHSQISIFATLEIEWKQAKATSNSTQSTLSLNLSGPVAADTTPRKAPLKSQKGVPLGTPKLCNLV